MPIVRLRLSAALRDALDHRPVVALTGPRQCGKTTLARQMLDATAPHILRLGGFARHGSE